MPDLDAPGDRSPPGELSALRRVCVYCGSSAGTDPRFAEAAEQLGQQLAARRIGLVYGGGGIGLMGIAARAVLRHGGHVTGIIPDFLRRHDNLLDDGQETVVVPDMHTRKQLMFEKADAFVALPGGIGTLEELVEQMTWSQLGRHGKPILLLDVGGFWQPLLALFAHMRANGFLRPGLEVSYSVAERVGDVIPMLEAALPQGRAPAEAGLIPAHF